MADGGRLIAGRYRLLRRVGAGAMGVVWEALDERLGRTVALKELTPPTGADDSESVRRAAREARIAARVRHPNAVTVHDVVEDDGRPVIVMEYVPARTLADHGTLPPERVRHIGAQIAAALAAAHRAGVVHRDVKPGNILLADDGTAKITDFGIARAAGDVTVTRTGLLAGTPAFLSPEAARGAQPGPAADVFSLGATLYAAVEGQPPFGDSDNAIALLHAVATGRFRPPAQAGPLTDVLMDLLRTDPATRPTMAQAADRLRSPAPRPTTVQPAADQFAPPPTLSDPPATLSDPPPTRLDLPVARLDLPVARLDLPVAPPRNRRPILLGIAVPVVAGLVVLAVLLTHRDDTARTATQTTTATTTTATTTSTTPTPSPAQLEQVVSEYYALLPKRAEQAWTRLGPDLQARGRQQYEKFWKDVDKLVITTPPKATGAATVTVAFDYTTDHVRVSETHRLGLVTGNGTTVIGSDEVLSTQRVEDGRKDDRKRGGKHDDE
ncbi:protein kinase domain-containing protein [Actinosynnema sp. CS-041913]|uniref:serine/threonine-protein kinase n=1 Tax=Actinosynnema sp. CS-041913 TaxID=3239917 RepID=UPI003D8B4C78